MAIYPVDGIKEDVDPESVAMKMNKVLLASPEQVLGTVNTLNGTKVWENSNEASSYRRPRDQQSVNRWGLLTDTPGGPLSRLHNREQRVTDINGRSTTFAILHLASDV